MKMTIQVQKSNGVEGKALCYCNDGLYETADDDKDPNVFFIVDGSTVSVVDIPTNRIVHVKKDSASRKVKPFRGSITIKFE